jgi:hypothetical protein
MTDASPQRYRIPPTPSRHEVDSRRMILQAAEAVKPGRVVVLGAGKCDEIPLKELVARFEQVVLVDLEADLIESAVAACEFSPEDREKIEIIKGDLTGLTEEVVALVKGATITSKDAQEALAAMGQLIGHAKTAAIPILGKFDLVVASCVLCQLHLAAMHRSQSAFVERFPDQEVLLKSTPAWTAALEGMARRMEAEFIDHLCDWTEPQGQIFLSETVSVAFVELLADGAWSSAGNWRLLKSQKLTDYFDARFCVETLARWPWVVRPPQMPGEQGRLFEVHATVLSLQSGL